MIRTSHDFEGLFGDQATRMREVCRAIYALPEVDQGVLFGSFAKGCAVCEAVKNGLISESRHNSYVKMYNDLKNVKEWMLKK